MFSAVWPECADMDVKKNKIAYIASKVGVPRRSFSRATGDCARPFDFFSEDFVFSCQ